MFKQKTSSWKTFSSPDRIMPAVSIIHNKVELYIKPQLSTRMQIFKMDFEKDRVLNKNVFRVLLSIIRNFLSLKSGISKFKYFLINFDSFTSGSSKNNIIEVFFC